MNGIDNTVETSHSLENTPRILNVEKLSMALYVVATELLRRANSGMKCSLGVRAFLGVNGTLLPSHVDHIKKITTQLTLT